MTDYTAIFKEFADCDTFVISRSLLEEYKQKAADAERERLSKKLTDYFDLTRFSIEVENAPDNPEWDAGFQAALALIKGENK